VGFVVDKMALGQVHSEYFGFPCNLHSTVASQSPSSIIWGWYIRPIVAAVSSGLTPLIIIIKIMMLMII
jgi:hypothetical protein